MMRTAALCFAAVVFIASVAVESKAQTAKEIVQKAIDAHGGRDQLNKYPGSKSTTKATMQLMGQEVAVDGETTYFLPDMGKNVIKIDIGGQKITVEQIWNGDKMKMTANGMALPVSAAVKAELSNSMYMQRALHLVPLLDDKNFDLTVIDKAEKVNNKEVVGVLVKSKGQKDLKLFFDAKTFVMAKIERKGLDPAEQEVDQQVICLDSKKFDGIMHPVKIEILNDGKKFMTVEVTDLKHLDKLDKKEFDISD